MTSNLHISANQWRVSILKACIGAHVARGVAEDIADAALALLELNQNPLASLLDRLDGFQPSAPTPPWPGSTQSASLGPLQVLHHGPSLVDMAQAGIACACEIDDLALLLGLAQSRLYSHGISFEYSRNGTDWQSVSVVAHNRITQTDNGPIWLRKTTSGDLVPLKLTNLPQPTPHDWARLLALASQIMVPADDTNRADAGAGLTDND
ncbi:MAG: hypothetical protein ABJM29_13640 [Rhizobiaceae bacterium]